MKILFLLIVSLVLAPPALAQENPSIPNSDLVQNYFRTIIVQTDSEKPVTNQIIICRQIPKKPGIVNQNEVVNYEISTNELGEANLEVKNNKELTFSCTTKEITTADYCWYFPYSTISFEIYEDRSKNTPIYLVGQESPDTCKSNMSEQELKDNIKSLIPQGTAKPLTNKNITQSLPIPTPTPENLVANKTEELTLWKWIILKLRSIFRN